MPISELTFQFIKLFPRRSSVLNGVNKKYSFHMLLLTLLHILVLCSILCKSLSLGINNVDIWKGEMMYVRNLVRRFRNLSQCKV